MAELESGSHRGWQRILLRSDSVEIAVYPELGATISSLRRRRDDLELLDQPPFDLPHHGHPLPAGDSETSRYDFDLGGWQSLFPNAGDAADVDGAEWMFDGEARVTAFDIDGSSQLSVQSDRDPAATAPAAGPDHDPSDDTLRLRARLRRCPAEIVKAIRLDGATVSVTETVRNVGAVDLAVMWGHQLRFGPPLIGHDAEFGCSASIVHPDAMLVDDVDYDEVSPWPRAPVESSMVNLRYLPRAGDETRLAYLSGLAAGSATISNSQIDCTVQLSWDCDVWPHLWYGSESGQTHGYPWYGTGYFLALTPNSSWPAHGLHDARRISDSALVLGPGQTRSQTVTLTSGSFQPF